MPESDFRNRIEGGVGSYNSPIRRSHSKSQPVICLSPQNDKKDPCLQPIDRDLFELEFNNTLSLWFSTSGKRQVEDHGSIRNH